MKNHAFLILAHKQPCLLARILRILEQANHHFFINIDKKTTDLQAFIDATRGIGNVFFIPNRISVYHAGVSTTYAELALLAAAMQSGTDFDYYHLISGQDYPLRSNHQFDDFFENTENSFMYIDDNLLASSMQQNYHWSINQYHFNNSNTWLAKIYNKLHIGKLIAFIVPRKPLPHLTGGWQWFSWNRKVATFVTTYLQAHPEYINRYNHTASADEHIFVSLLEPEVERLNIEPQNPLRYISWHPHRPIDTVYRPFNLTEEDYPFVIDSKAFFCRKVDEAESAKLLDMIDAQRGNHYGINEHNYYV